MSENVMINVTGLWLNTDKNNQKYMAGNCGNMRYWIFKNKNKKQDGDPDYILKISQNMKTQKAPKKEDKPVSYGDNMEEYGG